jgi:acetyl esterase
VTPALTALPRRLAGGLEARAGRGLARLPPSVQHRLAAGAPAGGGGDLLAPDVRLVLALRRRLGAASFAALGADRARRRYRRDCALHGGPRAAVGAVRDLTVPGPAGPLPARHYAPPAAGGAPLLVWFHGGGMVLGDLDTHDPPLRLLCREAGVHVLAVAYRLAPEHPFPAAVEDACAALGWALASAAALGADASRVAVGGDSAGGNLAAVAALDAAGRSAGAPALQLLVYPATDRAREWPSLARFADGFLLSREEIRWFHAQYTGGTGADPADPRLSPLRAPSLAGLPPALVFTAAFDPLRDEGEAYAERLAAEGTRATLRRLPGLVHGFVHLLGPSATARRAVSEVARALRAELGRAGGGRAP